MDKGGEVAAFVGKYVNCDLNFGGLCGNIYKYRGRGRKMIKIEVKLKKQPEKLLQNTDKKTFNKLDRILSGLEKWQGDIKKLKGSKSVYRLKKPPYRIIFEYDKETNIAWVVEIDLRGNIDYGRYV